MKALQLGILCFSLCISMSVGLWTVPGAVVPVFAQTILSPIGDERLPLADNVKVLEPVSPGKVRFHGGGATLDASNTAEGYVTIKYSGNSSRAKVKITGSGKATYTYDLSANGQYEVFPLTSGNGQYQIIVFHHIYEDQYAQALAKTIDVELRDEKLPFLYPNKMVHFSASSQAVAKGLDLTRDADNDLGAIANVYNFVVNNITYDYDKADKAKKGQLAGYIPDIDAILASGKGICFDYAALMTAMLRSQGIPTRMEFGYVTGGIYHAWISTYVTDIGWVNGVIQFDGKTWKLMDPTFAAGDGGSGEIMKFIGDGGNYQTKYMY